MNPKFFLSRPFLLFFNFIVFLLNLTLTYPLKIKEDVLRQDVYAEFKKSIHYKACFSQGVLIHPSILLTRANVGPICSVEYKGCEHLTNVSLANSSELGNDFQLLFLSKPILDVSPALRMRSLPKNNDIFCEVTVVGKSDRGKNLMGTSLAKILFNQTLEMEYKPDGENSTRYEIGWSSEKDRGAGVFLRNDLLHQYQLVGLLTSAKESSEIFYAQMILGEVNNRIDNQIIKQILENPAPRENQEIPQEPREIAQGQAHTLERDRAIEVEPLEALIPENHPGAKTGFGENMPKKRRVEVLLYSKDKDKAYVLLGMKSRIQSSAFNTRESKKVAIHPWGIFEGIVGVNESFFEAAARVVSEECDLKGVLTSTKNRSLAAQDFYSVPYIHKKNEDIFSETIFFFLETPFVDVKRLNKSGKTSQMIEFKWLPIDIFSTLKGKCMELYRKKNQTAYAFVNQDESGCRVQGLFENELVNILLLPREKGLNQLFSLCNFEG